MGPVLTAILGGSGPIGKAIEVAVDRLIPDKHLAAKLNAEIQVEFARAQMQGDLAQLEVGKVEAANPNLWVSGARPGIMWVCVLALFIQFVFFPVFYWTVALIDFYRCTEKCVLPMPPMLDEMLWQLVFGMLGMGAMRSFEKWKRVAS